MIAFNFDYYLPSAVNEAVNLFEELDRAHMKPVYYGGGTEIITFARKNDLDIGAVIDLKGIPEFCEIHTDRNRVIIGAGATLTAVEEAKVFPLLTRNLRFPADHTSRDKITFGGNICGRIIYKEAVLTPLILDAQVVIVGKEGIRTEPINKVFNKKLLLEKGEFLFKIIMDKSGGSLPYYAVRRIGGSKVGYPILSFAAVRKDDKIRFAVSGVCKFPFRSTEMEEAVNMTVLPFNERADEALKKLPEEVLSNVESGMEYRKFIFKNTLMAALKALQAG